MCLIKRKEVVLWGESSAEIGDFLELLNGENRFKIRECYVAKRGIGNNYQRGIYFPYDLQREACLKKEIQAPDFITRLVQWCCPDIIIANQNGALLTIEPTYHTLTYNNIAQRIPRQIRSSSQSIPNVIFQKVGDHKKDNSKIWFCKTFSKAGMIFKVPSLAILFTDEEHEAKRKQLVQLCNSLVEGRQQDRVIQRIEDDMVQYSEYYDEEDVLYTKNGRLRNWIRVKDDKVIVIPGVKPEGTGWKTKGTGLLDPYPGLVKMCEILFCYNDEGERVRDLWTFFREIPRDFWWFKRYPDGIYYRLIKEFSNRVYYKGEITI